MSERIGVGILTYKRPEFFKACLDSIDKTRVDEIVAINDGDSYGWVPEDVHFIQHEKNKGIGISKNDAFKHLLEKGCEHIFLIEDDIIVKDNNVFSTYIAAAKETGLKHMMFGYHGPANKRGQYNKPRYIVEYKQSKIALNEHCVGAFCYYQKEVLENVGLNDEQFLNAWEHVEHSLRIVKANYLPAYWWWPDLANSCDYIGEQACSTENSTIGKRADWGENIRTGAAYFTQKHGVSPVGIAHESKDTVVSKLKDIYKKYGNR